MIEYILIASNLVAYTFGYNERKCGDVHHAVSCSNGATTASGEAFKPNLIASAAIPLPKKMKMKTVIIRLKAENGECVSIRVNDKASEKWLGKRGFEFTPAALRKLGITPSKHWSGNISFCEEQSWNNTL